MNWESDLDGLLASGDSVKWHYDYERHEPRMFSVFHADRLSAGLHVVTATVIDGQGRRAAASAPFEVFGGESIEGFDIQLIAGENHLRWKPETHPGFLRYEIHRQGLFANSPLQLVAEIEQRHATSWVDLPEYPHQWLYYTLRVVTTDIGYRQLAALQHLAQHQVERNTGSAPDSRSGRSDAPPMQQARGTAAANVSAPIRVLSRYDTDSPDVSLLYQI